METKDQIIFAIGGGELGDYETLPIDKKIVEAADAQRIRKRGKVKALFIPTASEDDPEYCETFEQVYARSLWCNTDILYLYGKAQTKAAIRRQIEWCDMVYVGGGSTPAMMKMWRKYEVDKCLRRVWKQGTVMAGLSAGAVCWFKYALSDAYVGRWTTVSCLGFINRACNVHYSSEKGRKKAFDGLVKRKKITGIALDDNTCIKITNNSYEILKSDDNATAYWVTPDRGKAGRTEVDGWGEL
ncbi:MAG: peptidase E [candidate division Zixibacteria bacterium]|nr:peptidase E [candidate division Zixibacteria bacterium]